MTTKAITFQETTTGHVIKVNGIISWFLRKENNEWFTYRSADGGKGFLLIPSNDSNDTKTWGHKNIAAAKHFAVKIEVGNV